MEKTYTISIEEIFVQSFKVVAEDPDEALEIAREKYGIDEFSLDHTKVDSRNICVLSPETTEWEEF